MVSTIPQTPARLGKSTSALDITTIRRILARIVQRWHPLQIWLFGSRARGDNRADSDWDLFAIVPDAPDPADFDDPLVLWKVAREPGVACDLVVCRQPDFEGDRQVPNTLSYAVALEGVLLYESEANASP